MGRTTICVGVGLGVAVAVGCGVGVAGGAVVGVSVGKTACTAVVGVSDGIATMVVGALAVVPLLALAAVAITPMTLQRKSRATTKHPTPIILSRFVSGFFGGLGGFPPNIGEGKDDCCGQPCVG